MTMDRITEEISHFIGLFHTIVEDARGRDTYTDFSYLVPKDHLPTHPLWQTEFDASYDLLGFDPEIRYKAPGGLMPVLPASYVLSSHLHSDPVVEGGRARFIDDLERDPAAVRIVNAKKIFEIDPPGSVVNYIVQAAALADDDYFSVGGHGLRFTPQAIDNADLLRATSDVLSASTIGGNEIPGSSAELIAVIQSMTLELEALVAASEEAGDAFVHQADTIEGIYVNGVLVDEAPKLEDFHSFDKPEDDTETATEGGLKSNTVQSPDGSITILSSVEVEAGGNTALNNAVVQNLWTGAKVTAVVGDHFEINAIIQVNAVWDTDAITDAVRSWTQENQPNEIYNIATFERTDPLQDDGADQSGQIGFPSAWAVAEIQGDLIITNWLQQYIFMSDNDIGILSSSGITTSVMAGGNLSTNQLSIFELGFSYDLIIVGGSIYDANIIQQINILFDNDVVGAVSEFATTGAGTIAASGNLLWNQAYIHNIGGADRFDALPSAYLDAVEAMASGSMSLSGDILQDPAFAGLAGLRVLYVSGDLINTQYIKQVSIMGDSDQIALAMDAVAPQPGADWSVSTGGNALINNAAILDLDAIGKTYVGGGQYSQETLFQSGLVADQPELAARDPDALVNEAVAFLDGSMLGDGVEEEAAPISTGPDNYDQGDGLQHMLG
ncbi:MAG: hypothetical protein WA950_04945 [Shinella sp.]|uniref:hypothetical protein n=1 Tax=Shinella sp. TaxID=1870904 RepID=UPI003C77F3B7